MGLIEGINTGFSFNLYNDGTNWRRRLASGVGLIDCTAAGIVEIYGAGTGAADSVAAIGIAARFQYAGTNNFYGGNQFNGPITVVNSSCSVDARGTSTHGIVTTAGTNAGGLLAYANAQTIYGGCGYFAASSGTWCFYGAASSGFLQGGTWQVSSDARMKENFELIDPQASLEAVKALPAWSFTWKHARMTQPDKEPQRIGGWKAQEMKSLVPIAITERSVDKIDVATRTVLKKLSKIPKGKSLEALQDEPMKALGMDLQTVVATLWAAVQALSAKVEELEAAR